MQNLLKAIPSRVEYSAMTEEQKEYLSLSLATLRRSHDLPRSGVNYHPAEIMALIAAKHGYVIDLVVDFDLAVDYNE
jgi:hypothetical protein